MLDYQDFDEVFEFNPQYSYGSSAAESFEANRKALGRLFIDRLLKLVGINAREFPEYK
jgi:hypothetical protein